jgi:hypothetical protein
MRGVNDRNFFNLWQILYRATCSRPGQTHWRVGDVDWRKERHSFSGADYAVTLEVHHLRRHRQDEASWTLMVVTEHWWDGNGEPLKSMNWSRAIGGNPKTITAWLRGQDSVRSALVATANAAVGG